MDVTKSLDLTDKILDIANRYYIPPIGPIWNEVFPKEFQRIGINLCFADIICRLEQRNGAHCSYGGDPTCKNLKQF